MVYTPFMDFLFCEDLKYFLEADEDDGTFTIDGYREKEIGISDG
jgi:hypothetical protein